MLFIVEKLVLFQDKNVLKKCKHMIGLIWNQEKLKKLLEMLKDNILMKKHHHMKCMMKMFILMNF